MEKIVIGWDIDGTLSYAFLGLDFIPRMVRFFWNWFVGTAIGREVYLHTRRVNKRLRNIILLLREKCYGIVIVSFIYEDMEEMVARWLCANNVHYDRLVLARRGETAIGFKSRVIGEENLTCLVDDDRSLIDKIISLYPELGQRIIHFERGREGFVLSDIMRPLCSS